MGWDGIRYHLSNERHRTVIFLPVSEWCYHKSRGISEVLVPVPELCVTDVGKAILLCLVPPLTPIRKFLHQLQNWFKSMSTTFLFSPAGRPGVGRDLCRSWDCHMKAKEDSILFRIILLTTSLEWTSIVQIVITLEFMFYEVNKVFSTFCLSPLESDPRRRVMRLLSIPICFL